MIIPKKIKVIGKDVKVVVKKELKEETTLGQWLGLEKTIELKKDGPDMNEIFLHEILECINDRCDLDMEHKVISTMSEILYQVIKDNKLDFRK
jgi:hypothetical protein